MPARAAVDPYSRSPRPPRLFEGAAGRVVVGRSPATNEMMVGELTSRTTRRAQRHRSTQSRAISVAQEPRRLADAARANARGA